MLACIVSQEEYNHSVKLEESHGQNSAGNEKYYKDFPGC